MPTNRWFIYKNYKWFINEARPKTEKILSETGFSIDELNEICDSVEKIARGSYKDPDTIRPRVANSFGSDRLEHVLYWIVREATDVWEATYHEKADIFEVNGEIVKGTSVVEYQSKPKKMKEDEILRRIERGVHKYKQHISYRLLEKADDWRKLRGPKAARKVVPARRS